MPIYVKTITNENKNNSEFPVTISNNVDTVVLDYSIYGNCSPEPEIVDIDAMIADGQINWGLRAYVNEVGDYIIDWGNWLLSKGIPNFKHRDLKFVFKADSNSCVHIYWLKTETTGNIGGTGSCIYSTGTTWSSEWYRSGSVFAPIDDTALYNRAAVRLGGDLAGTKPHDAKFIFFDYHNTTFLGDYSAVGYVVSFSVNGTKYDIVLDAPLRVALDGTDNADELNFANQQIIRRVDNTGNTLSEPQIASVTLPEITLLTGEENTITFNTAITPKSMSLTYKGIDYKKVSKIFDNKGNEIASVVDNTGKQIYNNNK